MTKEEKIVIVDDLSEQLKENSSFYLTDISGMSANEINDFRKKCYDRELQIKVIKNTLIIKAMEKAEMDSSIFEGVFEGSSSIIFSEVPNLPGKLIKDFRGKDKNKVKPAVKAAYIDGAVYIGDDQLSALAEIKSKEDLVADVVGLLQSPMKNVLGALQSGGNTISGLVKTLSERK